MRGEGEGHGQALLGGIGGLLCIGLVVVLVIWLVVGLIRGLDTLMGLQ